jgi:hypothetical protein
MLKSNTASPSQKMRQMTDKNRFAKGPIFAKPAPGARRERGL